MLRRRHSLAVDGAKESAEFGAGAGSLGNFKTQAEAEKAAKDDAKAFKDGDLSLQDYLKKLQANQFDPDYCKTATLELGEARLRELEQDSAALDPDNPRAGLSVLANTLATAMRNGATFKDRDGNENLQLLAGLAPLATFPKDVLANLGKQCLAPGNYMYGKYVWQALAANPAAATQFVHDNMDVIPLWMASDSDHHGGLSDDQAKAFADVIKAGTIGGPGADQNMAADNTTKLIKFYAAHPDEHTHTEIENVFAQDIQNYWSDLQPSLTDPAPVNDYGAGHVSVSAKEWQAFVNEAMRDPKSTAFLLAYSKQQATDLADANPKNPEAQHASGLINGFFSHEAMQVYSDMGGEKSDDAKKWQSTVTTWLNTGIVTGVTVAFDPAAAVAPISKAVISEAIKFFADDKVKVDSGQVPAAPSTVTWQDEWTQAAKEAYKENPDLGNPQQYAQTYCGGKPFLTSDGTLVDNPSTQQRQAYNAWLQDPKLAQAADPNFQRLDMGRLDGMTGGN